MSGIRKLNFYNKDEINKKILKRPPRVHPEAKYLGISNNYRDDDYNSYKLKSIEFCDAAKQYNTLNQSAILHKEHKLDSDSNNILRYYSDCSCESKRRV